VRLVHFSTNYVFSGEGDRPWTEEDEPRPASGYARSKLEGEHRVHGELPEALLVRCAGLYGRGGSAIKGGSFPERILARARAGEKLRVIHDQRLNPTWTADLAEGVLALVERGTTGLVHLVADGCCSWYEFAEAILRLAAIDAPLSAIGTPPTGPRVACRPRNGCLSSLRVPPLRPWREGLTGYLASCQAG
jgi:dTDP-4-dehydrorhamnose reductase